MHLRKKKASVEAIFIRKENGKMENKSLQSYSSEIRNLHFAHAHMQRMRVVRKILYVTVQDGMGFWVGMCFRKNVTEVFSCFSKHITFSTDAALKMNYPPENLISSLAE